MSNDWKIGSRRVGGPLRQAEDALKGEKRYGVEQKSTHKRGELHVREGESKGDAVSKKGRIVHNE